MRRLFLLTLVTTGACAQAHREGFTTRPDSGGGIHVTDSDMGGGTDGNGQQSDGPNQQMDAPTQGGNQTLTETTSNTDTGIAIACAPTSGAYTLKNSYYRVFTLNDYGITGTFHVQAVDFGLTAVNSPAIKVSVGTYSGTTGGATLTNSSISIGATATINPGDSDTTEHVPLTADVAGSVVVEIDQTADGTSSNGYKFYPAANASGQTKPGYIKAAGCSDNNGNPITSPTDISQLAGTETDLVITVTGST